MPRVLTIQNIWGVRFTQTLSTAERASRGTRAVRVCLVAHEGCFRANTHEIVTA